MSESLEATHFRINPGWHVSQYLSPLCPGRISGKTANFGKLSGIAQSKLSTGEVVVDCPEGNSVEDAVEALVSVASALEEVNF